MKILLLTGESLKNKEEFYNIYKSLVDKGYIVDAHEWEHWGSGSTNIDIDKEVLRLLEKIDPNEELVVIGKSIGTIVGSLILPKLQNVKKVIFMGIPLGIDIEAKVGIFRKAFKDKNIKLHIIENREDPYSPIEEVRNAFIDIPFTIYIKEADNHRYNYPEDVIRIVESD